MAPFLAMIPLFDLWFGNSDKGIVLFVAYGVGTIMFVGIINAVGNVPAVYLNRAASAGASRLQSYRRVVLPAIFPELRSSILLSLGLAWSLAVAAELLGAPSGLGVAMAFGLEFVNTGRLIVLSLAVVVYAAVSYMLFEYLSGRLVHWQPGASRR